MPLRSYARCILSLFYGLFFLIDAIPSKAQIIGFYFEGDKNRVTIPFEVHNNLIIIPVVICKDHHLKFILDTGVINSILISKELADSIGITYQRSIQLRGVGDKSYVNAFVASNVSLELPAIKSNGLSSLVLEEDFLHIERHLGIRVHGIIGYDIFSRFVVKIDYGRQRITIYEPHEFKLKKKYHQIDVEIIDGKPISLIRMQLNPDEEIDAKLLIDTGASHALVLNQKSDKRIILPLRHIQASLGRGLEGEIRGYLGRIVGLDFGEKRMHDVIASFPEITNFDDGSFQGRSGSIGGELLKKFTVIFDYINSKVYVKPNRSFKFPFEYNMSGLEVAAEGEKLNQFVIRKIRNNSAAYFAGIEPGDIVVSLNNIPSKKLNITKIYTYLNRKEGKEINLTVFRDGRYVRKKFFLKKEI